MKGMILAAGFGTRLRPITNTLPKPLVPLCNRPLIGWAVESYLAAGVDDLIVNLHHLPDALESYLRDTYGSRATFFFSREEEILGTGGAIRRVRAQLEHERDFFLVNGDTVQFPNFTALRDARRATDALAALTLRHPPADDKFTAVWFENGFITGFGKGTGEALMFAGSHCISARVFEHLPDRDFSGIVADVYEHAGPLAAIVDDGLWFDIGTIERYFTASHAFREAMVRGNVAPPRGSVVRGDSIVHETAKGSATRSVIGANSVIEGVVVDSVIWDRCVIPKHTRVENAIVTHDGADLLTI